MIEKLKNNDLFNDYETRNKINEIIDWISSENKTVETCICGHEETWHFLKEIGCMNGLIITEREINKDNKCSCQKYTPQTKPLIDGESRSSEDKPVENCNHEYQSYVNRKNKSKMCYKCGEWGV